MKITNQDYEILTNINYLDMLRIIEIAGRKCYKSEHNIADDSAETFVKSLIQRGHESVIEHCSITVAFVTNRAIANELVRHRIGSYSQESTRYCNYSNDRFDNELTMIEPLYTNRVDYDDWCIAMREIEKVYIGVLEHLKPDVKRGLLPLDLKTEIVVTYNLRQWREVFRQRTSLYAHPQMRELLTPLLEEFKCELPVFFEDIGEN